MAGEWIRLSAPRAQTYRGAVLEPLRPQTGDVLVVASVGDAGALDVALAEGERCAVAERRRLVVLATFGISQPLRALIELGTSSTAVSSTADLDAQARSVAEHQVRRGIDSISPGVSVCWRCVERPARQALQLELTQARPALVVIGCGHSRRSRLLARRLAQTAQRHGNAWVTVAATRPIPTRGDPCPTAAMEPCPSC